MKGHSATLVPKGHYSPFSDDEEKEEAYWQGEEYRRNTPFITPSVYENMPEMIQDCLLPDLNQREKDLLLLSVLTAYSAVLPGTWAVYNGKRYSPHLFTIGIAPAGSGKSIATMAGELVSKVQQHTIAQSEQAQARYKIELEEWKKKQQKKQEEAPHTPEPLLPPYRTLILPATTSYSRMQIHIRDNGNMGSFIFDTEAQTLTNANDKDYGGFDIMLRKAFEHEDISFSYLSHGTAPVFIRRPMLAMLLTGTPEQLKALIENPENGLSSRILFYTFRQDPVWKEMGHDTLSREEIYEELAHHAFDLYTHCAQYATRFNLTPMQWKKYNQHFGGLLQEVVLESYDHLQAIVKRHGLMVLRIAMILTRIRQFEQQRTEPLLTCSDADFESAMQIVLCCYEHSRLLLTGMTHTPQIALRDPNKKRRFFETLPHEFSKEEALKIGQEQDILPRSLSRYLEQLIQGGKLQRLARGSYQKCVS